MKLNIKRLRLFLSYAHKQHSTIVVFLILLLNWDLIVGLTKQAAQ